MDTLQFELENGQALPGILDRPDAPAKEIGIVMAHGSSNDMSHPTLAALAQGLCRHGYPVLRFNFPYRARNKKSIDPEHRLIHSLDQACALLKQETGIRRLVLAGKSLGARMAAQGCAENSLSADGLIFLGYPLHAPGRKTQPKQAPLLAQTIPMLFFQGTRDPFCNLDTLLPIFQQLNAAKQLEIIQGGDHGFSLPKKAEAGPDQVNQQILDTSLEWLAELT